MVQISTPADREPSEVAPGLAIATVVHGERLHATQVTVAPGTEPDMHSHPHDQISYVVDGELALTVDGEIYRMRAGDAIHLPGGTPHGAGNETDTTATVVDIFTPPREDLLEV